MLYLVALLYHLGLKALISRIDEPRLIQPRVLPVLNDKGFHLGNVSFQSLALMLSLSDLNPEFLILVLHSHVEQLSLLGLLS